MGHTLAQRSLRGRQKQTKLKSDETVREWPAKLAADGADCDCAGVRCACWIANRERDGPRLANGHGPLPRSASSDSFHRVVYIHGSRSALGVSAGFGSCFLFAF